MNFDRIATTECIELPVCNTKLLYVYFQAIVRQCTELEFLRIQNLRALYNCKNILLFAFKIP